MEMESLVLSEVRGSVYSFLSSIYMQPVSYDFTIRVLDEDQYPNLTIMGSLKTLPKDIVEGLEIIKKFVKKSKNMSVKVLQNELAVEQTRLFRGISPKYGPPPPYEAVYREGRVMGESTQEVLRKYSKAGVHISDERSELPDQAGVELGFMQFLCEEEFKARKSNRVNDVTEYLTKEKEFINEHIAKWIPAFCDKVIIQAKVDFYLAIAKITKGFLTLDQELIEELYHQARSEKRA
jgi:TorA maturation chaperone TorD